MARDQKVTVRIEADGRQVDTTVKAAQRRLAELEAETKKVNREFESGKRSADDYSKAIEKIDKEAESLKDGLTKVGASTKGTSSALSNLGSTLKANIAFVTAAVASIAAFTKAMIEAGKAAYEHERSIKRLESALAPLGSAAAGVRDQLLEQASALAALTGQSDSTIVSMQALLAQMGVAGPDIAKAAQASVDLSAALGLDLNSAARNVGRTMGGFAGELGELIPELKNLSSEALKSGEGIDLLAEKFKGTAEAARTGAEAFKDLGNAAGDWGRNVVSLIANQQEILDLIDALAGAIRAVTPEFEHQETILSSWKDVLDDAADGTKKLSLGISEWLTKIHAGPAEMESFFHNLNLLEKAGFSAEEAFRKLASSIEIALNAERDMAKEQASIAASLSALGVTLESKINSELSDLEALLINVKDGYRNGAISARDYEVAVAAIASKQQALKDELSGTTDIVNSNTDAINSNAAAMDKAAISSDKLTGALNRASNAYREQQQAASAAARSQATGGSDPLFPGLSGARYSVTLGGGTYMANPQIGQRRVRVGPNGQVFYG